MASIRSLSSSAICSSTQLESLVLSLEKRLQPFWQPGPIPQASCIQLLQEILSHLHAHTLPRQQSLDPVDVSCALFLERHHLAMQLPMVFLLHRGDVHHVPHFLLSTVVPQQHGE